MATTNTLYPRYLHTTEPWVVDPETLVVRESDELGGKIIATIAPRSGDGEQAANAQLIAAAPYLLNLLIGIRDENGDAKDSDPSFDPDLYESIVGAIWEMIDQVHAPLPAKKQKC